MFILFKMIYFVRRATLCVLALVLFCCYVSGGPLAQLENHAAVNPRVRRSQGNSSHLTADMPTACNNSTTNLTDCKQLSDKTADQSFWEAVEQAVIRYKDVITRALIVFGSVALVVILYVSFRCIQKRRQMNKSRKYGLITTSASDDKYELRPLDDDDDDDDEDMTVFDRTKPKPLNSQARRPTNQRSKLNGKRSM